MKHFQVLGKNSSINVFLILIVSVMFCAVSAEFKETNNVILLTEENSQNVLESYQFTLLAFYNSDDSSASQFVQDYEKAAKMIKKSYKNAAMAYADCSVEEELCSKFRIEGTPTLKWYENAKTSKYKGGRTFDSITKWFVEKTGQPLNEGSRDDGIKEINDVLILTENNFDTAINKYKFVLVMFYADWHKQSQQLLPQFEKVAETLKSSIPSVAFGTIDCGQEKNLKTRFKLRTYPVLTWFTYGEDEPFTGANQTYDKILEWVQNMVTPITKEVKKEELDQMLSENEEVLVYFGENNKDFEIYERYTKTLESDHRAIAHSFDNNLKKQYQIKSSSSAVVMFKKFGASFVECSDSCADFKKSALAKFVEENSEAIKESNDVLELTEKTFSVALKKYKHVLVKFYAPWCGHCKQLAPHYEKASAKIKSLFPEKYVALAHVDATVETKLGSRYKVQGYPTLKFFSEGKEIDYDGGRTDDTIFQWINKKVGNASNLFTSQEKLEEFISNNRVTVVFFGSESSEAYKQFDKFTRNYDDMMFAHVFDPELKSNYNVQSDNEIVLFKKFDEKRNDCNCEFTQDAIKDFVNKYKNPIVLDLDDAGNKIVFGKDAKETMVLFYDQSNQNDKETFKKVAEKLRGKMLFLQTVMTDQSGKLATQAKVTAESLPQVRIVNPIGSEKTEISKYFIFENEITVSNLEKFYEDVHASRVKPNYKSQDIPLINDGPVFTLVANNVDKIVFDESRDVFIKVYAPWCGHCKAMKQAWEDLGAKLKEKNPKVLIAEYDATENSHDKIESQGFPTILYYKSGSKDKPINYSSGQRDMASLAKFIKENTAFPWVELDDADKKTDL